MSRSRSNVDRSWMDLNDRFCKEYIDGVKSFLEVAGTILNDSGKTRCPCIKCVNVKFGTIKEISGHLHIYGILRGYTRWTYHGENFKIGSTTSSVLLVNESLIENDNDDDDDDGMMDMLNDMQSGAFHKYDTEKQHSYDPDTWVSKHAKQHHNEILDYMTPAHVSETEVESNTMDSINSPFTDIDAMEKTLGHRPGYRRGYGQRP